MDPSDNELGILTSLRRAYLMNVCLRPLPNSKTQLVQGQHVFFQSSMPQLELWVSKQQTSTWFRSGLTQTGSKQKVAFVFVAYLLLCPKQREIAARSRDALFKSCLKPRKPLCNAFGMQHPGWRQKRGDCAKVGVNPRATNFMDCCLGSPASSPCLVVAAR